MTTEEKIDRIHDAVIKIQSDMAAGKMVCATVHRAVDDRLNGLHRSLKGNGQPGLEQKHAALSSRFDKLETRVITWASIAVIVGQILVPIVKDRVLKTWNAETRPILPPVRANAR